MPSDRTSPRDAHDTHQPTELSEAVDHFPPAEATGPRRVVVIMAHPDDAEFSCGGTVAKWAAAGDEVTFVLLTSGDQGSDDLEMTPERLIAIREEEQRAACKVLGIGEPIFLRLPDGLLTPDIATRKIVTRILRQLKPHVVICQDPSVLWVEQVYLNHPDHRAAGQVVIDAIFPATGNPMSFRELRGEGLDAWKIREVYLGGTTHADIWVDITETMDVKINALRAHACQLGDWDPTEEMHKWAREEAARHPGNGELVEGYKYFKFD